MHSHFKHSLCQYMLRKEILTNPMAHRYSRTDIIAIIIKTLEYVALMSQLVITVPVSWQINASLTDRMHSKSFKNYFRTSIELLAI